MAFEPRSFEPSDPPPRPLVPVIMCGGAGRRLWPLSRTEFPKQLLKVGAAEVSLFQAALQRAAATGAEDILIVTLQDLAEPLRRQVDALGLAARVHYLLEPSARNTAAAIAFAALYARSEIGECTLWVLSADHVVANEERLQDYVKDAVQAAEQHASLVTFGITPTRPETGYGYIELGDPFTDVPVRAVSQFLEKPNADLAVQFVQSGKHKWNSGMFILPADKLLAELRNAEPGLHAAVCGAYASPTIDGDTCTLDPAAYAAIPSMPIDTAVMEQSSAVAVVPCDDLGWSDVGSWQSWWEASPKSGDGNAVSGDAIVSAATNNLVQADGGRLVVCVGVDNLAVLETADAILVAGLDADGNDLRAAVDQLAGRPELHEPAIAPQDWGQVRVLSRQPDHTVFQVTVAPGATGTWQAGAAGHCTAANPVTVAGQSLTPGQGTPTDQAVSFSNPGAQPAVVIAVLTEESDAA